VLIKTKHAVEESDPYSLLLSTLFSQVRTMIDAREIFRINFVYLRVRMNIMILLVQLTKHTHYFLGINFHFFIFFFGGDPQRLAQPFHFFFIAFSSFAGLLAASNAEGKLQTALVVLGVQMTPKMLA
jgi:hypothetical protein